MRLVVRNSAACLIAQSEAARLVIRSAAVRCTLAASVNQNPWQFVATTQSNVDVAVEMLRIRVKFALAQVTHYL